MEQDLKDKKEGKKDGDKDGDGQGSRGDKGAKKNKGKVNKPGENTGQTSSGEGEGDEVDPNEAFADAYGEAQKKMPHAVSVKDIEKAFKAWKEGHGESPLDRADKEYAEKIGVDVADLRRYRDIVQSLDSVVNVETNESVIEELRNLINRIIARRLKPTHAPRYPVEEGDELVDPTELFTQVQKGNLEPRVWETTEIQERRGKKFGEVEITLVCDRSGSMVQPSPNKMIEQRKAAVLIMEALKEFADQAEEERINMDKPLEIRSEIYSFQATGQDAIPLKKMSKELGEKERIDVATTLSSAPGQRTTDFVSLEAINGLLDEESRRKIADGELKKIVIVFTDGESHGPDKVRTVLKSLRDAGVVAIGVGVTKEGRAALSTYAPDAKLAEKAEDLAIVLGDLLKEHLADL